MVVLRRSGILPKLQNSGVNFPIVEKRNREFKEMIDKNDLMDLNELEVVKLERGIGSIRLTDDSVVRFSYNKQDDLAQNNYSISIHIDEIFSNNEYQLELKDVLKDPDLYIQIYFNAIERVINLQFDPSFSIPRNKNILDPVYWRTIWNRIGLSVHSFDNDILKFISRLMEEESGV